MASETGLDHDRTEWPDKDSVRHRMRCRGCRTRIKITGSPIGAVDDLAERFADSHAANCK